MSSLRTLSNPKQSYKSLEFNTYLMDITLHCALAACPVEKSHFRAFFRLTTKLRILKTRLIHMFCYNAIFRRGQQLHLKRKTIAFMIMLPPFSKSLCRSSIICLMHLSFSVALMVDLISVYSPVQFPPKNVINVGISKLY